MMADHYIATGLLTLLSSATVDSLCPPGTVQGEHPDDCYHPFGRPKPWSGARDDCRHIGGDLVSVNSNASNAFLSSMLTDLGMSTEYWIGGMRSKGSWVWSDTSPFDFANWDNRKFWNAICLAA